MRHAPGRTPDMTAKLESSIVDKALQDKPIAATQWSTRTLTDPMPTGRNFDEILRVPIAVLARRRITP